MVIFIIICAIIVIEIVVVVMMDRSIEDGCLGCKYLDLGNDGFPCTKNIDGVCIPNRFKYREMEEVAE